MGIKNEAGESEINNLRKLCEDILQPIRNKWGRAITITSGFRCKELNKAVGGSVHSQHIEGEAADITSDNNRELWSMIISMIKNKEIIVGQLIDEKRLKWIHISLPSKSVINMMLAIK